MTDTDQTLEIPLVADSECWAAIAAGAQTEPEKALEAFTLNAIRILENKPRNMAFWLQKAIGQYDKRVGAAHLALTEAEKHKPAGGWREPATSPLEQIVEEL